MVCCGDIIVQTVPNLGYVDNFVSLSPGVYVRLFCLTFAVEIRNHSVKTDAIIMDFIRHLTGNGGVACDTELRFNKKEGEIQNIRRDE
jgi:hypothetical protein